MASDDQAGQFAQRGHAARLLDQLEAGHRGHLDIRQQRIGLQPGQRHQRIQRIAEGDDLVAGLLQHAREHLQIDRVVIHHRQALRLPGQPVARFGKLRRDRRRGFLRRGAADGEPAFDRSVGGLELRVQFRRLGGQAATRRGQLRRRRSGDFGMAHQRVVQHRGAPLRAIEQLMAHRHPLLALPFAELVADADRQPVRIVKRAEHHIVIEHAALHQRIGGIGILPLAEQDRRMIAAGEPGRRAVELEKGTLGLGEIEVGEQQQRRLRLRVTPDGFGHLLAMLDAQTRIGGQRAHLFDRVRVGEQPGKRRRTHLAPPSNRPSSRTQAASSA
jgi:hypothetical protein